MGRPEVRRIVKEDELIAEFHRMWDGFPGLARLVDARHTVLASNGIAAEKGFAPGCICAKVGDSSLHRECKLRACLATGEPQTDNVLPDRIRGWMPVAGRDDVCVHFAIQIPGD